MRMSRLAIAGLFLLSPTALPLPNSAVDIKQNLESATLLYFVENSHPATGLVRDKANSFPPLSTPENNVASIGATGFGLAVIANAAARGLVGNDWARDYFNKVMLTCRDRLDREHGWFLHFIDWETGKSAGDYNDFSSVDSAFLIAGALYAARVFPQAEGAAIARQLYSDLDFWWLMTDGGKFPDRRTLSIGYDRVNGFSKFQWSIYAEHMVLVALGLGHPTHPLPVETWDGWERRSYTSGDWHGVALDMPLFVHQYSHLFLDFRRLQDKYPNYFDTSATATRFNRAVCREDKQNHMDGFWGLSAGAAPGGPGNKGESKYMVYNPFHHVGTVCIACAIGSAMFAPDLVLQDAVAWRQGPYAKRIWGRYGFTDSIDLDQDWFAPESFGITVGAAYLGLANMKEETSVWRLFSQIPEIKNAMNRVGKWTTKAP